MKLESGQPEQSPLVITGQHSSRSDQPPDGWRLWLLAIRPKTLTISIAPVVAGSALAFADTHSLDPRPFAASLLGALAIQAGTNLYNDVGDALRGGDQPLRQGPPRVTALGWATPDRVKRAALLSFALAALVGLYLVWLGGWPIAALGLASLLAGWAYSSGPKPIAYTPTGEAFVIAFFGVGAVGGSYYLQTLSLTGQSVLAGAAIGAVAAAVLLANNYRDMEADRLAGRRTLAIRVGVEASKAAYGMLLLSPIALLASPLGPRGGWLCLGALPFALWLILRFATQARGPAFNAILAATARFQLLLAGLLAVGVLLL